MPGSVASATFAVLRAIKRARVVLEPDGTVDAAKSRCIMGALD
jgi:hypothetical protein